MRRLTVVVLLLLVSGLVSACGQTEAPPTPLPPTEAPTSEPTPTATHTPIPAPSLTPVPRPRTVAENPADQAYLRAANAVPDLSGIEFVVNGVAVASQLNYGRATDPSGIVAGEYTLVVRAMAQRGAEVAAPLIEQPLIVNGGSLLTLVLAGTTTEPLLLVYEDHDEPLDTAESRVSLINAVSAGTQVGLMKDGTLLNAPVGFGERSEAVIVGSGANVIEIGDAGLVLATHEAELRERRDYTLIFAGHGDDLDTLAVIALARQVPGRATLRAANMVEATTLDVYGNGLLLAEALDYTRIAERQPFASGAHTIEVLPAGRAYGEAAPLVSAQFNVNAGDDLALVVTGNADRLDIVRVQEDLSPTAPGEARVIFAHTIRQGQPANVVVNGEPMGHVPALDYRQVSQPVMLQASTTTIHFSPPGGGEPLESAGDVLLEPGFAYLFLVTGRAPEAPPLIFGEQVGTDETLALSLDVIALTETPTPVGGFRVVNALLGDAGDLSLTLDNSPLGPLPGSMRAGASIIVPEGRHTLTLHRSGESINLAELSLDIRGGMHYTLFVYGQADGQVFTAVAENPPTMSSGTSGTIRLVNTTLDTELDLALAYADATVDVFIPTPDETAVAAQDPYRQPLFARAIRLADRVPSREFSAAYPIEAGGRDLYIMDNAAGMIAAAIFDANIGVDRHYDVVAYQETDSRQVRAVLIPHE